MALTVFVINPANTDETWEMPTYDVKWTEEINTIKSGNFSAPFRSLKDLAEKIGTTPTYIIKGGPRKVVIKDESFTDDPLLFAGWLRDYQFSATASEPSSITINFADFGVMLSKRRGQEFYFYNNVQSGWIFRQELYIAQNQTNGDMGLTMAQLPATTSRQRTVERTNLLDLLMGMSNAKTRDGFDFDVDKNGVITLYSPQRGSVQENIIIESRNAQQPQLNGKLTSGLANKVYVQGGELRDADGDVTQEAMEVIVEDTDSQGVWGLHEEYISATDIATEPFLIQRGQQALNAGAVPNDTESITGNHPGNDPDWRSYDVGDWLFVDLPDYDLSQFLRVRRRTIEYKGGYYKVTGISFSREGVPNG